MTLTPRFEKVAQVKQTVATARRGGTYAIVSEPTQRAPSSSRHPDSLSMDRNLTSVILMKSTVGKMGIRR